MVGVFVRLKLRLLKNRLAVTSIFPAIGFVLMWLGALAAGLAGGAIFAVAARVFPDHVVLVSVAAFTLTGLAWIIVPVVAASLDDSLEPRRFELLPIGPTALASGLLAAGMIGPGTLATVLGLSIGTLVGFGSAISAFPILVVVVVTAIFDVAVARWLTTRLSDLLRHRRSQEVVALVLGVVLALPGLFSVVISSGGIDLSGEAPEVTGPLTALPWGALGRAAAAFGSGDWLIGVAGLAYGMAATVGAVWLLGKALDRLATRSATSAVRAVTSDTSLFPRWVRLPVGPVGAVAAKELRYLRRDVRVRSQLLGGGVAVIVLGVASGGVWFGSEFAPFMAVAAVFLVVASVIPNQFGFDGGSFWGYLTSAPDLAHVVRGKNLGWAVIAAPVGLVFGLVGSGVSGHWALLPAALVSAASTLMVWMAVGNLTSIYGAYRLPESNLFGNRNVSGTALFVSLIGMSVSGFGIIPIGLAVGLPAYFLGPLWALVGAVVSLGYAWLVYRFAARWAGRLADQRSMRLLELIDGE